MSEILTRPFLSPRAHVHADVEHPYRAGDLQKWLALHGLRHADGAWAGIELRRLGLGHGGAVEFDHREAVLVFLAEADALGFRKLVTFSLPESIEKTLDALVDLLARFGVRADLIGFHDVGSEYDEADGRCMKKLRELGQQVLWIPSTRPTEVLEELPRKLEEIVRCWWGPHHWHLMRECLRRRDWKGPVLQVQASFHRHAEDGDAMGAVAGAWTRENRDAARSANAMALAYPLSAYLDAESKEAAAQLGMPVSAPTLPLGLHRRLVRATSFRLLQAAGATVEEALDRILSPQEGGLPASMRPSPKMPLEQGGTVADALGGASLVTDDDVGAAHLAGEA
jgi:hypothetical protein